MTRINFTKFNLSLYGQLRHMDDIRGGLRGWETRDEQKLTSPLWLIGMERSTNSALSDSNSVIGSDVMLVSHDFMWRRKPYYLEETIDVWIGK